MANKIYTAYETLVSWYDSAGGGDNTITLSGLGDGAGRQGAMADFGISSSRASLYMWRFWFILTGTTTIGGTVEVYWKTADLTSGGHPDNDHGTGDVAMASGDESKLWNLRPLGVATIEETTAVETVAHGHFSFTERYGCPVIWNRSGNAFATYSSLNMGFNITPVPPEIQ